MCFSTYSPRPQRVRYGLRHLALFSVLLMVAVVLMAMITGSTSATKKPGSDSRSQRQPGGKSVSDVLSADGTVKP